MHPASISLEKKEIMDSPQNHGTSQSNHGHDLLLTLKNLRFFLKR